ncbi:filamentous hemagglutinin [Pseudomonas sp. P7]|uniref:RNase A-like domain-containing protein n=1 Tax=Pseudomonas sivasensis TaxID=1880678 RepID=UPI0015EC159B|nr:filamentous hemagglutinin [Pseudomonas sivasensis]
MDLEPNIPAASTFRTLEEAESLVSKTLIARHEEISKFLKGNKEKHIIREHSTQTVGLSLIKGTTESVSVYKFILVLKRKSKMPDGYLLLTGYPIEK